MFTAAVVVAGTAAPARSTAEASATELAEAIAGRLQIMPDVAAYKWINDLPIDRPLREAELIDRISLTVAGETERSAAQRALRAQIEASKAIQRALFVHWETRNAPTSAVNLDESRVRIDSATRFFMLALADFNRHSIDDRCRQAPALNEPPTRLDTPPAAWRIAIAGVIPTRCGHVAEQG